MEKWHELELYYSKLLRDCDAKKRKSIYKTAYTEVSKLRSGCFIDSKPENRTAGTTERRVKMLSKIVSKNDNVLEIGCGRGYTCLHLSKHVKKITGIEVSMSSINEAKKVLHGKDINNVTIHNISAVELNKYFSKNIFNVCYSIDVVEHLHPEDAILHFKQVFEILKKGGKYIILMPNRLNGPHDMTKEVFPQAEEALGFHLNEMTYTQIIHEMKKIGFKKIQSYLPIFVSKKIYFPAIIPAYYSAFFENIYKFTQNKIKLTALEKFIGIRLIANKI